MKSKGKRQISEVKNVRFGRCVQLRWSIWLKLFSIFAFCLLPFSLVRAQTPLRLAVIDFVGDQSREFSGLIREAANLSSNEMELLDDDLVRTAANGAGYAGSLNLSRDEAKALGQSLGCDFYVLGKTLAARRLTGVKGEQFYFEALAGLFFVETRTGKLILFSFESAKAQTEIQANGHLKEILKQAWPRYAAAVFATRKLQLAAIEKLELAPPAIEVLSRRPPATKSTDLHGRAAARTAAHHRSGAPSCPATESRPGRRRGSSGKRRAHHFCE